MSKDRAQLGKNSILLPFAGMSLLILSQRYDSFVELPNYLRIFHRRWEICRKIRPNWVRIRSFVLYGHVSRLYQVSDTTVWSNYRAACEYLTRDEKYVEKWEKLVKNCVLSSFAAISLASIESAIREFNRITELLTSTSPEVRIISKDRIQ